MEITQKIQNLRKELDSLYQIESTMAVLGYDQQVLMPVAAAAGRARQLEFLSSIHHERLSADALWDLTQDLYSRLAELDANQQVIVRELHRNLQRSRKLSVSFVSERSRVQAESFSIWCEARSKNDWESVKPQLEKIFKISREEAQLVGYTEHPYDALLDSFEPYAVLSEVKPLLLTVAGKLKDVLPILNEKFGRSSAIMEEYSSSQQQEFCKRVMRDLGFNFDMGRLDTAAHPFMSTLGARDIRVTTRYNSKSFLPALFGTIHESGHAFYEIGLPEEYRGTPRGSAISMGIHESQSRLWENMLGRSSAFCQYIASTLPEYFESKHTASTIWTDANHIHPSLIRVEADEVSYTLHIVIRMLMEEKLISGDLSVADAPSAWNELYKEYLGLEVPEYSQGIMQDVHWYGGSIGYFPSYALGNLYAAMFIGQFELENGSIRDLIEKRSFSLLKDWLSKNIYELGQSYSASELVMKVCKKPLSSEAFIAYLTKKFEVDI